MKVPLIIKTLLLTSILICSVLISKGQEEQVFNSKRLLEINTGYSKHIFKDDIVSPLKYSGATAPIGVAISWLKPQSIQNMAISFDKVNLKSSISDSRFAPYTNNINANIRYAFKRKVYTIPVIKTNLYLGGEVISEISYRDHFYDNYYNEITGEFITSLGPNLTLMKNLPNGNDDLRVNFYMALFAYTAFNNRYNVAVGDATENLENNNGDYWKIFQNGNWCSINSLREFKASVGYRKFISPKIGISFTYNFHFYKLSQHKDTFYVRHLNNQLMLGLIFKIKNRR